MKVAVEVLAAIGALCLASSLGFVLLLFFVAARRETREREQELDRAIERHPANGCESFRMSTPDPLRAPCGAWIGDGVCDYWQREFAALIHVQECATCQLETEQRRAA